MRFHHSKIETLYDFIEVHPVKMSKHLTLQDSSVRKGGRIRLDPLNQLRDPAILTLRLGRKIQSSGAPALLQVKP